MELHTTVLQVTVLTSSISTAKNQGRFGKARVVDVKAGDVDKDFVLLLHLISEFGRHTAAIMGPRLTGPEKDNDKVTSNVIKRFDKFALSAFDLIVPGHTNHWRNKPWLGGGTDSSTALFHTVVNICKLANELLYKNTSLESAILRPLLPILCDSYFTTMAGAKPDTKHTMVLNIDWMDDIACEQSVQFGAVLQRKSEIPAAVQAMSRAS